MILGLKARKDVFAQSFSWAAQQSFVSGFAVGRTIFAELSKSWMSEKIEDSQTIH